MMGGRGRRSIWFVYLPLWMRETCRVHAARRVSTVCPVTASMSLSDQMAVLMLLLYTFQAEKKELLPRFGRPQAPLSQNGRNRRRLPPMTDLDEKVHPLGFRFIGKP